MLQLIGIWESVEIGLFFEITEVTGSQSQICEAKKLVMMLFFF